MSEWNFEEKYPLLHEMLTLRGMPLLPVFRLMDAANLFATSKRNIQDWIASGAMPSRKLPKQGRFLPVDLEEFLVASKV